jgi:acyl-CoA synthetase (AMP-forming)/AMP-acid ligase II
MEIPARFSAASHVVDRHVAEGRGDRTALRCGERAVTYAALHELVHRVGSALEGLGVQEEQRVLLVLADGIELVATFFGAIARGMVPVPVNTFLRTADYRYLVRDTSARVAVVSEELLHEVGPALQDAPHLRAIVVVGRATPPHLAWDEWALRASPAPRVVDWYAVDLDEGQTVTAATSDGAGGCSLDTAVVVYDEQANPMRDTWSCDDDPAEIGCDDDGGPDDCSSLAFTAPAAGTYFLRVLEWNDDAAGSYVLSVSIGG